MIFESIIDYSIKILKTIGSWVLYLLPLLLLIVVLCFPKVVWEVTFQNYLDFIKIIVWPFTVLTLFFFFKKILAYLFFSISGFNFFGIKGEIKNVEQTISEEVERRIIEQENQKQNKELIDNLNERIRTSTGNEVEIRKISHDILKNWQEQIELSDQIIDNLKGENARLQRIIGNVPTMNTSSCEESTADLGSSEQPLNLELTNQRNENE